MEEIRFELDCNISVPHFHREMEILYVLFGQIAVVGSGCNYVLEAEDFIVFNPYEHHEMYARSSCHIISCYIAPEVIGQAELGMVSCCTKAEPEKNEYYTMMRSNLAMLFEYYQDSGGSRKLHILSQLFQLLAILKTQFEKKSVPATETRKDADRMQESLTYLGQHFSENITMQEVADDVYLSKSHLSREFQKQMGVTFSDYLRKLRLAKAERLLVHSDKTVTEIALDCGFSNASTFITNFRDAYRETPGNYRKKMAENISAADASQSSPAHPKPLLSYMNLLKYASKEKVIHPLDKKQREPIVVQTNLSENRGTLSLCHNDTISIGWARSLLSTAVYDALKRAVKEVGFRYVSFLGVMDDSMDIYHEAADGTPWLSFTYLDILIDEILDLGAKPSFVFSYTPYLLQEHPQVIFGPSYVNIPTTERNLDKWTLLVTGIMDHFQERYGSEELRKWRFLPMPAVYLSYGVFSVEEYLEYYRRTYRSIRNVLPEARIHGFYLDTGFIALDGPDAFVQMLDYCRRNDCLPDAFTFQCFSCDYSRIPRGETEKRIAAKADQGLGEPAQVSANPHVLRDEIKNCREILTDFGLGHLPIYLDSWNATIWQNDLSNDTCYKSAFVVKNMLECCEDLTGISYAHLTDVSEKMITNSSLFYGGYGLFTYNGVPKAGYYAFQFLTMLQEKAQAVVARGKGYLITRSDNNKKIQILLYHYCHYDQENHISHILSREKQCSVDRYYCFEKKRRAGLSHLSGRCSAGLLRKI